MNWDNFYIAKQPVRTLTTSVIRPSPLQHKARRIQFGILQPKRANPALASVAVVAQDQHLKAELHFVRLPDLGLAVLALLGRSLLVLDWTNLRRLAVLARMNLHKIQLRSDAEPVRRQRHAAGVNRLLDRNIRRSKLALASIDPFMLLTALNRVGVVNEDAEDKLIIIEPRTVNELV